MEPTSPSPSSSSSSCASDSDEYLPDDEKSEKPSTSEEKIDKGDNKNNRKKSEDNTLKYQCKLCEYSAQFPNKLRRHMNTYHNEKIRYRCTIEECKEGFKNYQDMRIHMKECHPILNKCQYCSYENKTKAAVRRHIILNHKNGIPCTIDGCNVKVAKNRLKKHIREEHGTWKLGNERVRADGFVEMKCPYCEYKPDESKDGTELRREDINLHVETIHKTGIKCPLKCGKTIKVTEIDEHLKADHPDEEEILPVPSLALSSIDNQSMTGSMSEEELDDALHNGNEEPAKKMAKLEDGIFKCDKCGKGFMVKDYLRKHIRRVHEKVYSEKSERSKRKCEWKLENEEICGKMFSSSGLLDDHMNYHKGLTPYKCNTCDQSFHARARFAVHLSKYHQMSIKNYTFIANNFGNSSSN